MKYASLVIVSVVHSKRQYSILLLVIVDIYTILHKHVCVRDCGRHLVGLPPKCIVEALWVS